MMAMSPVEKIMSLTIMQGRINYHLNEEKKMKNLLVISGVALGLAFASFGFAKPVGDRFVTATFHCPGGVKNLHYVKVIVANKHGHSGFMVYKRVHCGQTKKIGF
jgi:hypothetical protein